MIWFPIPGIANVANNVVAYITWSMKNWNMDLMSCGEFLAKLIIGRGIFKGDSLSPPLFVIMLAGLEFPSGDKIKEIKEGGYKYLEMIA